MKETIENLGEGVERNTDKGYEIGTMEEAQKFSENRKLDLEKISWMLWRPQKIKIEKKEFDQVELF